MLELVRFSTTDPAKFATELDRFVRDLQREFTAVSDRSFARFKPRSAVYGRPGVTVSVTPLLGEMVPLHAALGPIDVLLPAPSPNDAGRAILLVQHSAVSASTLRAGSLRLNGSAGGVLTLPASLTAYLVVWDGSAWWTVNDAT